MQTPLRFLLLEAAPWNAIVLIGMGGTQEAFLTLLRERYDVDFDMLDGASGVAWHSRRGHFVWLEEGADHSTIAHELLHVVCGIMRLRGVGFSRKSEETYAYTLSYLLDKFYAHDWTPQEATAE